jgi:WXG100 family type VII secretion target
MKYRINHAKVIAQAYSIQENANRFNEQIQQLTQLEQDCRSCWKGEAADAFLAKLNQLKDELTRTSQQMSNLASTIKYCADRIQREDQEAERRARILQSGHQ